MCDVVSMTLLSHEIGVASFAMDMGDCQWRALCCAGNRGGLDHPRSRAVLSRESLERAAPRSRACHRVARVGAAVRRELLTPERTSQSFGLPGRPRDFPERLAPASGEGKPASPSDDRCGRRAPQRSAEKTRGRAGSPTRATFYMASYLNVENCYPALP